MWALYYMQRKDEYHRAPRWMANSICRHYLFHIIEHKSVIHFRFRRKMGEIETFNIYYWAFSVWFDVCWGGNGGWAFPFERDRLTGWDCNLERRSEWDRSQASPPLALAHKQTFIWKHLNALKAFICSWQIYCCLAFTSDFWIKEFSTYSSIMLS